MNEKIDPPEIEYPNWEILSSIIIGVFATAVAVGCVIATIPLLWR
jgi:hypothetical protein